MIVCLIYPPVRHMIRTNVPSVVDDVTGCYPPLGLLYVAGAIEAAGLDEAHVVDCVAEGLDDAGLEERIRRIKPDVVGIQAITFSILDACNTARLIKRLDGAIPVVMGGPHVNLFPEETMSWPEVDYALLGEGENNIGPFLDALRGGMGMASVPGAVYRGANDEVKYGPANPLIENLDMLPTPARRLLDARLYSSALGKGKRLTTMMSSRGCPAKCVFCDRPHLGKRFRARSAAKVVEEMQACLEQFGIDEFFFYDDTFSIDKERVLQICGLLRERRLSVFWDIRARISGMDKPVLEALREAGCARIHFGIESGNEGVLRALRKGINLDLARDVFKWCRETGIESLAYFMLGSPGEGHKEARDTIDYALSLDCDYIHVAVTTPFPGTELYRMGLESGLYTRDYWREFALAPTEDFVPEVWEENLSRAELVDYMFQLYRKFYGRPAYLLRRLAGVRSFGEFKRKAGAGLKILLGPRKRAL